jgi:CRP-like cAMP-binding protein
MTPVAAKKSRKFNTKTFLSTINGGRTIIAYAQKQTIFAQGDLSDAVFYIHKGKVKLTVVSKTGKEATIGILNEGDFFGEGCLTGQVLRNRNDRLFRDENRQEAHDRSASSGTILFRPVRGLIADTEHTIRRGFS